MRRGALLLTLAAAIVATTATTPAVHADEFGLAQLLSRPSPLEQPLGPASTPDVTPDGRYVVFTSIGPNAMGPVPPSVDVPVIGAIYRLDRATGALAIVAYDYGNQGSNVDGATNPSISADGRYVAFSTDKLLPGDVIDNSQAYVRDMTRDGDDAFQAVGILPGQSAPYSAPGHQIQVPAGQALSDDGRHVIFTDGQEGPYWRDLDTGVTRLVPVRRDQVSGAMTDTPVKTLHQGSDAAVLSGDGSTVVWATDDMYDMVRHQPGEAERGDPVAGLMWRRIGDGDRAPIHSLTGPVDLDDPACGPDTPVMPDPATAPGPCDDTVLGSGDYQHSAFAPLSVSRDGATVAFIANEHARGLSVPDVADAYVTTVFPGQSRKAATQPLTRAAPLPGMEVPPGCQPSTGTAAQLDACVAGVSLSPDGRYVALVTVRTVFVLNPPSVIGTPPAGVGAQELYLVDRAAGTLQLLSRTPSGAKQDGRGAGLVQLTDDASTAVFESSADNLVTGDTNQFTDIFAISRQATGAGNGVTGPEVEQLPAIAGRLEPAPDWMLRASAHPVAGGAVAIDVTGPAAGSVRAVATVAAGGAALAQATARLTGPDAHVTLTLRAPRRARPGAAQRVAATVAIVFTPADEAAGATLRQALGATLTRAARAAAGASAKHSPAPRLSVRSRRAAHGGVAFVVQAPAAGVVTATATHGGRAVARLRARARHHGAVRLTLRPRGGRRRLVVTLRYTPAGGTAQLPRTARATVTAGGGR